MYAPEFASVWKFISCFLRKSVTCRTIQMIWISLAVRRHQQWEALPSQTGFKKTCCLLCRRGRKSNLNAGHTRRHVQPMTFRLCMATCYWEELRTWYNIKNLNLFKTFWGMCIYVCMHVICMSPCARTCMCFHVKARGQCPMSVSIVLHIILWGTGSLTDQEVQWFS